MPSLAKVILFSLRGAIVDQRTDRADQRIGGKEVAYLETAKRNDERCGFGRRGFAPAAEQGAAAQADGELRGE